MKKLLSLAAAGILLLSCMIGPVLAAEDDLPFELVPPAYVTAQWLEGDDSPTTTRLTYSLSNEMTAFFKDMENAHLDGTIDQFMEEVGCDDIWMSIQIDWALDDVNDPVSGWHYTEYWDGNPEYGLGYDDEGSWRVSEWDLADCWIGNATETVNDVWILRGLNEDMWYGNPDTQTPGVKEQLNADQYTYDEADGTLYIDFDEHTAYFRARFVVTVRNDEEPDRYCFSDWSETASVGKDSVGFEPLTEADLAAPVITDLRMTDREFNDNPVVAFTLTVPDQLMEDATRVQAAGGGIVIEIEGRVRGDEEFTELQGDWIIKAGEMEADLFALANEERPVVPRDSEIELRCRYRCDQPGYTDEPLWSDWSEVITFGTDDIRYDPGQEAGSAPAEAEPEETVPAAEVCPVCHRCFRPLGLCVFLWLVILLVVIAAAVAVVVVVRKKKTGNGK